MTNGTHFPINWTAIGVWLALLTSGASCVSQVLEDRADRLRKDVTTHGNAIVEISQTVSLLELKIRYIERDLNAIAGNSVPGGRGSGPRPERSGYRPPAHNGGEWINEPE